MVELVNIMSQCHILFIPENNFIPSHHCGLLQQWTKGNVSIQMVPFASNLTYFTTMLCRVHRHLCANRRINLLLFNVVVTNRNDVTE
jgi:hypothetical protein